MLNLKKLIKEQEKISKKVILKDFISIDKIKFVAGVDCAFKTINNKQFCFSVITIHDFKTLNLVEEKHSILKIDFPYIPNFLSYRELPGFLMTLKKIRIIPNVFLFDANGILHVRNAGFATHAGIIIKKPTVGVAKKLLCGFKENNFIYLNNKKVGFIIKRNNFKELFVSPGNMISLRTAIKIVKNCFLDEKYRLPEPLRIADKISRELRDKYYLK